MVVVAVLSSSRGAVITVVAVGEAVVVEVVVACVESTIHKYDSLNAVAGAHGVRTGLDLHKRALSSQVPSCYACKASRLNPESSPETPTRRHRTSHFHPSREAGPCSPGQGLQHRRQGQLGPGRHRGPPPSSVGSGFRGLGFRGLGFRV